MANREELGLIRGARGGQPMAQLALAKLYLYGSAGLPKSLPTALHWLDRAAQQGCHQACALIGAHIPAELALQSTRPLAQWYERAFDAGVLRAGLVLAQLTLDSPAGQAHSQARREKALRALEAAARAGLPDARWLFARYRGEAGQAERASDAPATAGERRVRSAPQLPEPEPGQLEQLWRAGRKASYLELALPMARALAAGHGSGAALALRLEARDVLLLSRCAQAAGDSIDPAELQRFREIAASEHDRDAQFGMGLWWARMQVDGARTPMGEGSANFKKAIRWLNLAGEQGLAAAWYALSRIYIKPEFSQRNVADAQRYLERAAEMGYRDAQLECGNSAWRARRENENNDVRAAYWLQRAAQQGCPQARAMLHKIAPRGGGFHAAPPPGLASSQPLLAARLQLAALFQLSRAEALLLDVRAADQGHCLVVDIRASYGRSKRRLVMVETPEQRHALDLLGKLFDHVDAGPGGPEGNYRQRLYRLKTCVPSAASAAAGEETDFALAA